MRQRRRDEFARVLARLQTRLDGSVVGRELPFPHLPNSPRASDPHQMWEGPGSDRISPDANFPTCALNSPRPFLYRARPSPRTMSDSSDPGLPSESWSIASARAVYNIQRWGAGYFDINDEGHVVAKALQNGVEVDLVMSLREAKGPRAEIPAVDPVSGHSSPPGAGVKRGLSREHLRVQLHQGSYRGVFPIKVNQLGRSLRRSWKAGRSSSESRSAASRSCTHWRSRIAGLLIICNGYKDHDYQARAPLGIRLGSA